MFCHNVKISLIGNCHESIHFDNLLFLEQSPGYITAILNQGSIIRKAFFLNAIIYQSIYNPPDSMVGTVCPKGPHPLSL